MKLMRKPKLPLTKSAVEKHPPSDINLFTDAGVRLRIVSWDQLPHLQYKMGDRECYARITWEEFRRFTMGEYVDDVLPWFHNPLAQNFWEERP